MALTQVDGGLLSPINGQFYSMKNRIINGAMVIDQRNAGASVTPANAQYLTDRFSALLTQSSKFTAQQNAGAITPPTGYVNYLGMTSSSSYSIGSGDAFGVLQKIEGLNVADLGWGAAGAATITLSFWVRSSLTGTFGGSLLNSDVTRSYPFTYTINSANTWEQKTITIAGDTTGTWLKTNGIGIQIHFGLGVGSTYSGTANVWAGAYYLSPTGATSVVGTNGATLYITGVQLEKGSTATSFDYRPYGTELALCQRYYQVCTSASNYAAVGNGTTALQQVGIPISTAMRATPTFNASVWYASGASVYVTGSSVTATAVYTENSNIIRAAITGFTGLTDNRIFNVASASTITLSAEL